ncbi:MAG: hypothetical protein QOC71_999 [Thermoplasmata archaeon]|jgi:hypothetical protein|nr:hypothetical protein [Thermoplasmata archaeon]
MDDDRATDFTDSTESVFVVSVQSVARRGA